MALLEPGQDRRIVDHAGATGLDPAVSFVHGLGLIMANPCKAICFGRDEAQPDVSLQGPLIAFESQDVVAILIEDLLGDGALTPHGINGHKAAGNRQLLQQVGKAVISSGTPWVLASTLTWPRH